MNEEDISRMQELAAATDEYAGLDDLPADAMTALGDHPVPPSMQGSGLPLAQRRVPMRRRLSSPHATHLEACDGG
eukprot:gene8075-7448_t